MSRQLVAYFSASKTTAKLAKTLASTVGADLYEIRPERPYTPADLDWTDKNSRSSVEMRDPSSRPAITGRVEGMEEYGVIYLGFPIWWYLAPTIINTFLESYRLDGKVIVPFATSGGSGMGRTNQELQGSCRGADLREGRCFRAGVSATELKAWVDGLGL